MGPEWITAIAAVAGLVAGAVAVYARMRLDLASMNGRIEALDMEISRLVRQQIRLENLIVTLLGRTPLRLDDFRQEQ